MPASFGHYVENTGNSTLRFLEIFNTDRYEDISLNQVRVLDPLAPLLVSVLTPTHRQWLALTPPDLVKAHLGFDDETIALLSKTKPVVMGPA